jgi:hypothetical protein
MAIQKWEYAYVIYDSSNLVLRNAKTGERHPQTYGRDAFNKLLTKMGDEGWEMVSVSAQSEPDQTNVSQETLYFKRPVLD